MVGLVPPPEGGEVKPLPAEPPIGGALWEIVVPAILFLFALTATVMLYRHFARRGGGSED